MLIKKSYKFITLALKKESNNRVNKNRWYEEIINLLSNEKAPLSCKDIAVRLYKKGISSSPTRQEVAPRVTELTDKGILKVYGEKYCPYTNHKVSTYVLGDKHD